MATPTDDGHLDRRSNHEGTDCKQRCRKQLAHPIDPGQPTVALTQKTHATQQQSIQSLRADAENKGLLAESESARQNTGDPAVAKLDSALRAPPRFSPAGALNDRLPKCLRFDGEYRARLEIPQAVVEPYAFWRIGAQVIGEDNVKGGLNFKTYGFRWVGKLPAGFDYGTEVAIERGKVANTDFNAWAGHWVLGTPGSHACSHAFLPNTITPPATTTRRTIKCRLLM